MKAEGGSIDVGGGGEEGKCQIKKKIKCGFAGQ